VTERVITVSDSALAHLKDLRSKQGVDHLYLRMGVRSGGCSGMSYVLDVMKKEVRAHAHSLRRFLPPMLHCAFGCILCFFRLRLE